MNYFNYFNFYNFKQHYPLQTPIKTKQNKATMANVCKKIIVRSPVFLEEKNRFVS